MLEKQFVVINNYDSMEEIMNKNPTNKLYSLLRWRKTKKILRLDNYHTEIPIEVLIQGRYSKVGKKKA